MKRQKEVRTDGLIRNSKGGLQSPRTNKSIREARAGLVPSEETDNARVIRAEFTHREWDTVLATLRHWQQDRTRIESLGMDSTCDGTLEYAQWQLATEHGESLTDEDIDKLCERINCSPEQEDPVDLLNQKANSARSTDLKEGS
jgi:hypothetical protein